MEYSVTIKNDSRFSNGHGVVHAWLKFNSVINILLFYIKISSIKFIISYKIVISNVSELCFIIILFPFFVWAEPRGDIRVSSFHDTKAESLPMRQFIVYVEKPGRYNITVLMVGRRSPQKNATKKDIDEFISDQDEVISTVEKMHGKISIYDIYRQRVLYSFDYSSDKWISVFSAFDEYLSGLGIKGGNEGYHGFEISQEGYYAIRGELYGGDAKYQDYTLSFKRFIEPVK